MDGYVFDPVASYDDDETQTDASISSKETMKFANYKPAFVDIGDPHPYPLCEGSVLSCVQPPPITYVLKMNPKFYRRDNPSSQAHLSDAQLEAIIYALQSHEKMITSYTLLNLSTAEYRQGFFLGDGTGTGKSRVLAGIIYESQLCGIKRTVYITACNLLFATVKEEIQAFLPDENFIDLNSSSKVNAELDGIMFLTYYNLSVDGKLLLLKEWMGEDFDGLIIFDEAHKAKGAFNAIRPSTAGVTVDDLQIRNPKARVVYSSATGASEPFHLLYMSRLGIVGPYSAYKTKDEFSGQIDRMGVVALELVAAELKMKGVFVSRMVSLENIDVFINEVSARESFKHVYHRCSQMWLLLIRYVNMKKHLIKAAKAEENLDLNFNNKIGILHSGVQNFFAALILSSKVYLAAKLTRASLSDDKSVIIGIQSTGESRFTPFEKEKWNKGRPYSYAAATLRHTLEKLGIRVGCPKLYLKTGEVKRIGDWNDNDEEEYNVRKVDEAFDEYEEDVAFGVRSSKKARTDDSGMVGWPSYSVGSYWMEVSTPDTMTWSFGEVARNITADGLAKMFHELSPLLPINALDELGARIGVEDIAEGAMCKGQAKASPLDECLYDNICSDVGVASYNEAIVKLSKDQHLRELLNLVQMVEIGTNKSYYTRTNDEMICRSFNRMLLLPLDIQKQFLQLLYDGIRESRVINYSPLIEIPGKLTSIRLKTCEEFEMAADTSIELYTFTISRVANLAFIKDIVANLNLPYRLYINGTESMLAYQSNADNWIAYYPYTKSSHCISSRELDRWKLVEDPELFYYNWNYLVEKLEENPSCLHMAKGIYCKKSCMFKWGVRDIVIISGYTSFLLQKLPIHLKWKLRMAKAVFGDKKITKKCIGILLDTDKQDDIVDFIKANFEEC
ncbi:unnamed protein product [Orchesella dallaii]|uniref:Helicase ATP-binding domain-containing protein n=1 Tax=Orchesella dallaii TaxID=48710 RepID=A0ABP1R6A4_9HEXA